MHFLCARRRAYFRVRTDERLGTAQVPAARFACAAVAFLACSVILVPGELLKSRIQAGASRGRAETETRRGAAAVAS